MRGFRFDTAGLVFVSASFLAVVGAGCGDDGGGGGGGNSYAEAAAASFRDDPDFPFDDDSAECFAGRLVDVIGVDRLENAGVTPEDFADEEFDLADAGLDLGDEEASELASAFPECDIAIADLIVIGIEEDGAEVPDDLRACLEENIDDEAFADVFGTRLRGSRAVRGRRASGGVPVAVPRPGVSLPELIELTS